MSLDAIRSQIANTGKVFSFPKFGANPPAVQNPVAVSLQSDAFKPFQLNEPAGDNAVRIVLSPRTELPNLLERSMLDAGDSLTTLSDSLSQTASANPTGPIGKLQKAIASQARALANAITPDTEIDENGNLFGTYKQETAEYPPAATPAETKEADAQAANINTKAIKSAFKQQLEKVPSGFTAVTVELPEALPAGVDKTALLRDLSEMAVLNGYNYNQFREGVVSNDVNRIALNKNGLKGMRNDAAAQALNEGTAIGEATNLARHLVDSPANPDRTEKIGLAAKALASSTMKVDVRDKAWLQGQKMEMMLSVGDGNAPGYGPSEPRMVEMVYQSPDFDPATGKTVLLVGKGIVFDTGGTNLKPSEFIHNMRGDMAGGAAVIGALKAVDAQQLKNVKVVGLVPLTENRIGNNASLENRAVVARNGKRVAISNTDAEGRLVLGDAVHYGMETYKPDVVADIATLTGGKVRGLGAQNAVAISGNNRDLLAAADSIEKGSLGRRTAVLPLTQAHHMWVTRGANMLDSKTGKPVGDSFADVYNSVGKDDALNYGVLSRTSRDVDYMMQHSAQGAAFVREFLANPETPWVHYDMAGAEFDEKDAKRGNWEWATGFGVKDLYHLVNQVSDGKIQPNTAKTDMVKPYTQDDLK